MKKAIPPLVALTWAILAAGAASAQSIDRVRLASGATLNGSITSISPLTVVIRQNNVDKEVSVNELDSVEFAGEPNELKTARHKIGAGEFANAKKELAAINAAGLRSDVIKQEVAFYSALADALAARNEAEITEAGKGMLKFINDNGRSFHYLQACEVLGDLLVAAGKYPAAAGYYEKLAQSPWTDYQMRAGVLVGRSLQRQSKHAEAIAKFDEVLSKSPDTDAAKSQQLAAKLGKAVSLAEGGKPEEAIQMIEGVIHDAKPEEAALHALAYNALGRCQEKAGNTKAALLAYLHVDVLYNTVPDAHAESLARLSNLWVQVGKPDRARAAAETLKTRYPGAKPAP